MGKHVAARWLVGVVIFLKFRWRQSEKWLTPPTKTDWTKRGRCLICPPMGPSKVGSIATAKSFKVSRTVVEVLQRKSSNEETRLDYPTSPPSFLNRHEKWMVFSTSTHYVVATMSSLRWNPKTWMPSELATERSHIVMSSVSTSSRSIVVRRQRDRQRTLVRVYCYLPLYSWIHPPSNPEGRLFHCGRKEGRLPLWSPTSRLHSRALSQMKMGSNILLSS